MLVTLKQVCNNVIGEVGMDYACTKQPEMIWTIYEHANICAFEKQ